MKKILSFVLVVIMVASLAVSAVVINVGAASGASVWNGTSVSSSLSGSGTKNDPYLIQSAADLKYLANAVNANHNGSGGNTFAGKYIKQTVDIDLGNHKWIPIGYREMAVFQGVYDGDGHSIVGLSNFENGTGDNTAAASDISYRNGLFGGIGTMGRDGAGKGHIPAAAPYECGIANLTVEGNITLPATGHGNAFMSGGLVSFINDENKTSANKVYITNVVSNINVTVSGFGSGTAFGGICGMAFNAVFENVTNNGNVTVKGTNTTYHPVGGFAGRAENCEFINCVNNGKVDVETYKSDNALRVGGIVGQYYKKKLDQYLTFENCINNGKVSVRYMATSANLVSAGGILGGVYYSVDGSMKADTLPEAEWVYWSNFKVTFKNCVNTGDVTAFAPNAINGVNSSGKCTVAGILSTTYAGVGQDSNNGGFLFDSCVNVGMINGSEPDRLSGITSCIYTDWNYTYYIQFKNCMTGSAKTYPNIGNGSKAVGFSGSISNDFKAEILSSNDNMNACSFNTTSASTLVNWIKTLVLESTKNINGMPTGSKYAVFTGVRNFSAPVPYTVSSDMIVTDDQGNRVTEITTAGNYKVKLALTGVTPYVTDQFALKYSVGYEKGYVDANGLQMSFAFGSVTRIVSLAGTETVLNKCSLYGKTEANVASGMFHNILPRQLGETVTMTLSVNGETLISYDYSLVNYAVNQLSKSAPQLGLSPEKKAQLDNLLVDMLKYGAEDQKVNDVPDAKLVTNALTEEQLKLGSPFSKEGLVNIKGLKETGVEDRIKWYAVSLVFDNTITMRMKFTLPEGAESLDEYDFRLITTCKSLGVANIGKTNDGYFYMDVVGFAPMEYEDEVSVTFVNKNGTLASDTLTYSVNSYLVNKSESATYGALVRALTSYSASVNAFLG